MRLLCTLTVWLYIPVIPVCTFDPKFIIHSSALQLSKLIRLDRSGKYALFDAQEEETWSDTDSDDELEQVPPDNDICGEDVGRGCSISAEQEECWD